MVVVTHKMSFAREAAHKVIFIDHGLIVEAGTTEQVFENTSNERLKQHLSFTFLSK